MAEQCVDGRVHAIGLEPIDNGSADEFSYQVDVRFSVMEPVLRAGQRAGVELP